jgi:hypothetical protein
LPAVFTCPAITGAGEHLAGCFFGLGAIAACHQRARLCYSVASEIFDNDSSFAHRTHPLGGSRHPRPWSDSTVICRTPPGQAVAGVFSPPLRKFLPRLPPQCGGCFFPAFHGTLNPAIDEALLIFRGE